MGAVETHILRERLRTTLAFNSATAWEPWRHVPTVFATLPSLLPSIRPRHGSRGDFWLFVKSGSVESLQFGHGMGAVETCLAEAIRPLSYPLLQFGHGMGAVETK